MVVFVHALCFAIALWMGLLAIEKSRIDKWGGVAFHVFSMVGWLM